VPRRLALACIAGTPNQHKKPVVLKPIVCLKKTGRISVIIYDSWEAGDAHQIVAAGLWTLSNLLALPDALP